MSDYTHKIVSFDALVHLVEVAKAKGMTVAMCHGVFDLVHPGHILHMKEAKKHGDLLVVTLTRDEFVFKGPGRPYFNQRLRLEAIAALQVVDYVALNNWPASTEAIRLIHPNVYVKGADYAQHDKDLTGNIAHEVAAVEKGGGTVIYTAEETFSSSALINNVFRVYPQEAEEYLRMFKKQHDASAIIEQLHALKKTSVLVVGEAMIDQYCYCQPLAKMPTETTITSKYETQEQFVSGSLCVARQLAQFCNTVTLVTVMGGEEAHGQFFRDQLPPNIDFCPIIRPDGSTIVRRAFVNPDSLQKMFEVQCFDERYLDVATEQRLVAQIRERGAGHDLVVVGDYGHGMQTPAVRETLYQSAQFLALNAQTSSANLGFNLVTRYRHADYVCLNESELQLAAHSRYGELTDLAGEIRKKMEARVLMVLQGPQGNALFPPTGMVCRTPVLSKRMMDHRGAAEAVFAVTSPCVYRQMTPAVTGFVASCIGALEGEAGGNRAVVDASHLYKFITHALK